MYVYVWCVYIEWLHARRLVCCWELNRGGRAQRMMSRGWLCSETSGSHQSSSGNGRSFAMATCKCCCLQHPGWWPASPAIPLESKALILSPEDHLEISLPLSALPNPQSGKALCLRRCLESFSEHPCDIFALHLRRGAH